MKTIFYSIFCLLLIGCNPLSTLGPSDKPDFDKMPWESMEIQYWIKTEDSKKEGRSFDILDSDLARSLLSKLNVKEIKGYSIGVSEQNMLAVVDGTQWDMNIVFKTELILDSEKTNIMPTTYLQKTMFFSML